MKHERKGDKGTSQKHPCLFFIIYNDGFIFTSDSEESVHVNID